MGKKKNKQVQRVVSIAKETKKRKSLKVVLSYVSLGIFFALAIAITDKYTNATLYWKQFFYGNQTAKYSESEGLKNIFLEEYEANKKKLSREVRLDLIIARNRFNKIVKKYLSPREYNIYMILDYIDSYGDLEKKEKLVRRYFYEKILREMTPEERKVTNEDLKVFERIKDELKQIQSQKPEKEKEVK